MTPKQFNDRLRLKSSEIKHLMERTLPVKIGAITQSHYKENFRNSGFDGTKWKTTWRQQHGSGAASSYGPLLSKRKNLYNSITRTTGKGTVTISTNVEYAAIHNEGGTLHPKVTPKMRKFAWAKFFEASGIKKGMTAAEKKAAAANEDAKKWLGLALTKKTSLSINIPKRQFIGESEVLSKKIIDKIDDELNKILKQ